MGWYAGGVTRLLGKLSVVVGGVLAVVLAVVLVGCGDVGGVCLQAEVEPGLTIAVHDAMGPDERPRAGMYTFTVTTEFGVMTWDCEVVADDATGQGCASDHSLTGENDTALLVSTVAGEEGFRMVLTRLESNVWTGPDEVRVEIERDGEAVADESYAPKYVYSQRNGGGGCPQYWVLMGEPPVIGL